VLRFVAAILLIESGLLVLAQTKCGVDNHSSKNINHLNDFQVIELRRYTVKEGELSHFIQYFDTYFPEGLDAGIWRIRRGQDVRQIHVD
jgi:hypothetical protein